MKVSERLFRKPPGCKTTQRVLLLGVGSDFGMRQAHVKEVPESNPITLGDFFLNVVLKSSEHDRA